MRIILIAKCLVFCLLFAGVAYAGSDTDRNIDHDRPHIMSIQTEALPGTDDVDVCQQSQYRGDTMKIVAILVEYSDEPSTFSPQDLEDMLFSRGVWPGGSLAEYFDEVSYGKLTIIGNAEGWFNLGVPYEPWDSWIWDSIAGVLDPYIDYSQYDANGDDTVDAIIFVPSVYQGGENDNEAWILGGGWWRTGIYVPGPHDGMMLNRFCYAAEKRMVRDPDNLNNFLDSTAVNYINTFCHELAHSFTLPDLYDYDAGSDVAFRKDGDNDDFPMVDWCLMDGSTDGHAFQISMPFHLCGWSKMKLNWIEPIVLEGEFNDVVIHNIETHVDSSLYLLPITPEEGEYFLLEYRNPHGSHMFGKYGGDLSKYFYPDLDFGPELLDRGLLITHVHDSLFEGYCGYVNNGLPDYPHYMVAAVDAGYNPDKDYTYNPEGRLTDSAQWWYPYQARKGALFSDDVEGQSEFGPETVPNSDGYFGPSDIYVRVDSIVGDRLYAYVNTNYSEPSYVCGDANGDGQVDQLDIAYLIDYLHKDGPAPDPMEAGDANGDGEVDRLDAKYLIDFLHRGGPPPVCP
ncbi:MAG: hypothetical protein JSV52_13205 [Candidatus Zixiibacteriota bacterium]|nr:MAG: hypothetical protein JSV52_13205 [candidate division Zixibacteria bacterium]